jgi:hypothetical protein
MIFRGTQRNKRRGFHNLYVFNQKLQHNLTASRSESDTPQEAAS